MAWTAAARRNGIALHCIALFMRAADKYHIAAVAAVLRPAWATPVRRDKLAPALRMPPDMRCSVLVCL